MRESFLHLVWQNQNFINVPLTTVDGQSICVEQVGFVNDLQGPDFKNALLVISGQKWAGNVEVHLKSSDWYAHQHQDDTNYSNIILHVVYEYDIDVYDQNGYEIPTIELRHYIKPEILDNYQLLMSNKKKWIYCESEFLGIERIKFKNWLERVYVERLERKTHEISGLYKRLNGDWEATLFYVLVKYFGGNLNGDIFLETLINVDFTILRKQFANKTLDSLLFGVLNLLPIETEEPYVRQLKNEFNYQKQKYNLGNFIVPKVNFYGCRPHNFPTIRLAQFIALYQKHHRLFSDLITQNHTLKSIEKMFDTQVDVYWRTHYNFNKNSKNTSKNISKSFVELLIINVIIPLNFLYNKTIGKDNEELLELIYQIAPEQNSIINKFNGLGYKPPSALETQALISLKKEYCEKKRCASCAIGVQLLLNVKD